jgi:hypothetical protein
LSYKPFLTDKKQFVVCCNTLGQNREFTAEEKFFVTKTVKVFQELWSKRDQINLAQDIENKISSMPFDA